MENLHRVILRTGTSVCFVTMKACQAVRIRKDGIDDPVLASGSHWAISCKSSSIHSIGDIRKGTSLYMVQNLHLLWVQPWVISSSGQVGQ